ncbi:MAG: adenylate kinase [Eubacteriales bacterium]|nr:adenylate kinase [Eubacteriales bacterium]
MNIVMLGAPGAGKGTVAKKLQEEYKIPHISTGDIFRENIKNGTELGLKAKSFMDKGELVPDEITINMLLDRIEKDDAKEGFILDGFPRTINQAEALKIKLNEKNTKVEYAILLDTKDEDIIKRLSGRRVCENCGKPYHIETLKPKTDGICDDCNNKLIQRKDDTIEVIKDRLNVYHKQTQPLVDYYQNEKVLHTIDGFQSLDAEIIEIKKILNK